MSDGREAIFGACLGKAFLFFSRCQMYERGLCLPCGEPAIPG